MRLIGGINSSNQSGAKKRCSTIGELYPESSPVEQEEAETNLRAYLDLVVRIYERISKEPGGKERLEKVLKEEPEGQ